MLESCRKGNTTRLTVALAITALALSVPVCSAQAYPGMHATPAGHSRPDAAPDSHEECVFKAIRAEVPLIDQSAPPILGIADVLVLPLMRTASRLIHSFEEFRDTFFVLLPTHERSPPVSFLS